MRTSVIAGTAVIAAALLLAGCGREEEQWQASTGSPPANLQPAAYRPEGSPAPGQLRGCLSGSNETFTLVEERTATVYRLEANDEPEANPSAREVYEDLRLHDGAMVEVAGELRPGAERRGAPDFEVRRVTAVASHCPASLMGAVNEFNRPPATHLNLTKAGSVGVIRGSMRQTRPPVSIMPVNPAR